MPSNLRIFSADAQNVSFTGWAEGLSILPGAMLPSTLTGISGMTAPFTSIASAESLRVSGIEFTRSIFTSALFTSREKLSSSELNVLFQPSRTSEQVNFTFFPKTRGTLTSYEQMKSYLSPDLMKTNSSSGAAFIASAPTLSGVVMNSSGSFSTSTEV